MAGVPDRSLEKRVAQILKRKDMRDASDRAVAKEAECGRMFVRIIRAKLIAHGMLAAPERVPHSRYEPDFAGPIKVRGGYLLVAGKVVRESLYHARLKAGRAARKKR